MAIASNTFGEIQGAPDEATLVRLSGFVHSGPQDQTSQQADQMINARLSQIRAQKAAAEQRAAMEAQAKQFRTNMPAMQEQQYGQVQDASRQGLAQSLAGVDRNANRRGLLYSGMRAGARQDLTGQYASGESQARTKINNNLEGQAQQMEQGAIGAGFDEQQAMQGNNDEAYKQALQARQSRNSLLGSAIGGAGSIAGSVLGRKAGS